MRDLANDRRFDRQPKPQLLTDAAPWLEALAARKLSEGLIKGSTAALKCFGRHLEETGGPRSFRDVRLAHLEAWRTALRKRKIKPTTIRLWSESVKRYFGWLARQGRIFDNPAADLDLAHVPRPMQWVPSEREIRQFIDAIPTDTVLGMRDRAIVETFYSSGLRLRELIGMDLSSVDLRNRTVRIRRKWNREQVLPLTRAAVEAIRLYLRSSRPQLVGDAASEAALWISGCRTSRLSHQGLEGIMRVHSDCSGVRMSPHALRRAFATHMLRHGAHPMALKELLGHMSFTHLKYYLRYAPTEIVSAHRQSRLSR